MVVVLVALLVGLGFMGVGVSYWSQMLNIIGTVDMGTWGVEVTEGTCSPSEGETLISCSASGNELQVAVTSAQVGVNYYCQFTVTNTGSIPVKIQSIVVDPSPPASGVVVEVTDMFGISLIDIQIDSEQTKDGKVHVYLADDTSQGQTFSFTVTFNVVQWNQ